MENEATKTPVTLESVLNAPLSRSGTDVPEGNYPGALAAFGEPFELEDKFPKPGRPVMKMVFEARFAVMTKEGVQVVDYLIGVPDGGAANRRSALYKMLKSLRGTDPKFFASDGTFAKGVTLAAFVGSPCTVQVKMNTKEFPTVEAVTGPVDGAKVPNVKDIAAALAASEKVPF